MQLNAEINRNLSYLSDSDVYLEKALDSLRELARQKRHKGAAAGVKKIHVKDGTLPVDSDLDFFTSSTSDIDDEKLLEKHIQEKYAHY